MIIAIAPATTRTAIMGKTIARVRFVDE